MDIQRAELIIFPYCCRAIEVWGSMDALQRERKKRRESELERNLQVSNVKRLLRDIARGEGDGGREERDAYQVREFEFPWRIAPFISSFFERNLRFLSGSVFFLGRTTPGIETSRLFRHCHVRWFMFFDLLVLSRKTERLMLFCFVSCLETPSTSPSRRWHGFTRDLTACSPVSNGRNGNNLSPMKISKMSWYSILIICTVEYWH